MARVLADFAASARRPWRDLRTRAISAAILGAAALLCLWAGGVLWVALVLLVAAGLAVEWQRLTRRFGWALALAGIPYIGAGTVALIWLRGDPRDGLVNVLFLVLIVWASDIGAYLVGRWIGGPKLAPAISPGKTWSGALGGLVAAVAAGCLVAGSADARIAIVAALLAVVGMLGDLFESFLKRRFGVKDSGAIIPGHGGLFDRLDGMLTAAPAAALLAWTLGRGVELWR